MRTFYRWCLLHDDFTAAVRVGKDAADDRVERSLYQRAVGYDYVAEKVVTARGGAPIVMPFMVHVPADVRAALHWLAIRRPKSWARTPEQPETDIARLVAEGRQRVARESAKQAVVDKARFKAAVETEVARRMAPP
ncbi:hypothetical protein U1839_24095 [Sphingomonas sp. RT2P30]|uniref:hypothetical protein n=1 Tax=Parasphingomonas halimpatiens TaxID=3096162 RepID=UPI002FC6B041